MAYMYAEEMELLIAQHELEQMNEGITNLMAIYDHVTKFGVSDALKDLVGEASLEELGMSVYNVPASKDTVDATAEDVTPKAAPPSLLKRIIAGIKKVFSKIFGMFKKIYGWIKDKFVKLAKWIKTQVANGWVSGSIGITPDQIEKLKLAFSPKEFANMLPLAKKAFYEFGNVITELFGMAVNPNNNITEDEIKTVLTNKAPNYEKLIPAMEQFRNKMLAGEEVTAAILVKEIRSEFVSISKDYNTLGNVAGVVDECILAAQRVVDNSISIIESKLESNSSDSEKTVYTERIRVLKIIAQVVSELGAKYGSIWGGINRCMGMLCSLIKQIHTFQYSNLKSEEEKAQFRKQYDFNPAGATA